MVRPDDAYLRERLNARPSRVSESSITTTCLPASHIRLARSIVSSETATCRSASWSLLEAMHRARGLPSLVVNCANARRKSVTSSGRSSTSSRIISTSAWLRRIEVAMSFSSVVLPALGGETINPRWPRPIGQNKSASLHATGHPGYSSVSRGCGSIDVRSSNGLDCANRSGSRPSMATMDSATCRPPPPLVCPLCAATSGPDCGGPSGRGPRPRRRRRRRPAPGCLRPTSTVTSRPCRSLNRSPKNSGTKGSSSRWMSVEPLSWRTRPSARAGQSSIPVTVGMSSINAAPARTRPPPGHTILPQIDPSPVPYP